MNLASPELVRNVRHVARRELRRSPGLWREYRRRRWQLLRLRAFPFVMRLMLPVGLVLMPASLAFPLAGGMRFIGRDGVGPAAGAEIAFAAYSLAVVGLLAIIAGANDRAYVSANSSNSVTMYSQGVSLRVFAHLPIADRQIRLPHRLWLDVTAALIVLFLWLAMPCGILAWKVGMDLAGWLTAAGCTVLQILTVLSAVLFVSAYSPTERRTRQILVYTGMFVFLAALLAGMLVPQIVNPPRALARGILWLTPYGWPAIAFVERHLGGADTAWLMALPAVAFIGLAVPLLRELVRSDFAIKEFLITPSGWYGVLERGFRVPTELPEPPPLMAPAEHRPAAAQPRDAAGPERTVRTVAEPGQSLRPRHQVLERVRDALLSPRERLILGLWSGITDRLTLQWLALIPCLGVLLILPMLPRNEPIIVYHVTLWGMLALLFTRICIRRGGDPKHPPLGRRLGASIVYLPIAFSEVSRAAWKQEIVRSIFAAPLFIGFGVIMAPHVRVTAWEGIGHGLVPVLLMLSLQPLFDCFKLSSSTNDTRRIAGWIFWIGGGTLLLLTTLSALAVPSLPMQYALVVAVGGVNAAMWLCYDRAYRLGKFDVADNGRT